MLTLDATAFVEEIAVAREDKRAARRQKQVSKAQIQVLEESLKLRMAEQVLASIEAKSGSPGSASDSDERAMRARLLELREQLTAKRQRVEQLEEEARRHEAQRPTTKLYRLHSESHHMTYSEAQYERLWARQRTSPVRILTSGGLSWWWYADRFWWGDPGLRAHEISALVLELDRETGRQRDSTRRAVASAGGATPPALTISELAIPDVVRHAVWQRDQGHCVRCGEDRDVGFDVIVPISRGGSMDTQNVELLCRACRGHGEDGAAARAGFMSRQGRPIS